GARALYRRGADRHRDDAADARLPAWAEPDAIAGMNRRALGAAFAGLLVLCLAATLPPSPAATGGDPIRGARPGYGPASIAAMPNEAAIGPRLWVPGLDDWYNPQGLAVVGPNVFVAAYRSDMPRV